MNFERRGQLRAGFEASCRARLDSAGVRFEAVREEISLDMLYQGQTHTVNVPLSADKLDLAQVSAAFEARYQAEFGRVLNGIPMRVINLRYALVGVRPKFDLALLAPAADAASAATEPLGEQAVYVHGGWVQARRYARLGLPVGTVIEGPAILEQPDTTVWLEPGFTARVDRLGNLILQPDA